MLIREEKPDILHTHLPRADLVGAIGHFFYASIPWVCSIHAIYGESWSGKWTLPLFKFIWRRPDVLIGISQAVKVWLVHKHHVSPEKVTVIYYGIEPKYFLKANSELRRIWNLDGNVIIGSIGRLESRKGHGILIKAMPLILKKIPSPRTSDTGNQAGGCRQRGVSRFSPAGVGSAKSPFDSTRVNPSNARTSLTRSSRTVGSKYLS